MFCFKQFWKLWGATSKSTVSSAKMPISVFRVAWIRKLSMDPEMDFSSALMASSRKHCNTPDLTLTLVD